MASTGHLGFGTIVNIGGSNAPNLRQVSTPEISVDMKDITSHGSASQFRDFIAGLKDGGEVTLEGNFNYGMNINTVFLTGLDAGTAVTVAVELPSSAEATYGSTWTFTGYVSQFGGASPYDDLMTYKVTIKVSGRPVLSDDAS